MNQKNEFNEVLGETIPGKVYNSIIRSIRYGVDGFTVKISDTRKNEIETIEVPYRQIDKYRKGVLI